MSQEHKWVKINYIPLVGRNKQFDEFRGWLEEKVGPEDAGWSWIRGHTHARGVVFNHASDAVAFKIRFKL